MDHRATFNVVLGPDATLVGQDDRSRDREPNAHALLLGRKKRIEDFGELVRWNTWPGIRDRPGSTLQGSPSPSLIERPSDGIDDEGVPIVGPNEVVQLADDIVVELE